MRCAQLPRLPALALSVVVLVLGSGCASRLGTVQRVQGDFPVLVYTDIDGATVVDAAASALRQFYEGGGLSVVVNTLTEEELTAFRSGSMSSDEMKSIDFLDLLWAKMHHTGPGNPRSGIVMLTEVTIDRYLAEIRTERVAGVRHLAGGTGKEMKPQVLITWNRAREARVTVRFVYGGRDRNRCLYDSGGCWKIMDAIDANIKRAVQ
jgi:hypothetical protein